MSAEGRIGRQHGDEISAKIVYIADSDLSMDVNVTTVVASQTAANTNTVTLPSVARAAGKIYTVHVLVAATGTCTVEDLDGDAGLTDIVLNVDKEYAALYSDGYAWILLVNA